MNKKINKPYEYHEDKSSIVSEPALGYGAQVNPEQVHYTYADYLTWSEDMRCELINGVIHMMGAPLTRHARLAHRMSYEIETHIRKHKGKCEAFEAPFDVRLLKNGETDDDKTEMVVQPDIVVVCDQSKLDTKGCLGAPDLVMEILSPSSFLYDLNDKLHIYESAGVKEYWIVNPETCYIKIFHLQKNGKYDNGTIYKSGNKTSSRILKGFNLDIDELFKDI
jgi:Uma2 family endonuclease